MNIMNKCIAAAAVIVLAASCSDERQDTAGQGKLILNTNINSDLTVVSRATQEELADGATIWIANEKGVVRSYKGISQVPASIDLVTGQYKAIAWAGDSVSASFDSRCYKGATPFEVKAGATTQISLDCNIANAVVSVLYDADVDKVLTDYTMTVGHKRGSLVFNGRDDRKGYFMMPSYSPDLEYELKGTLLDGKEFTFAGEIKEAQPATEYVLNVKYTEKENTMGGAVFSITIDRHEIEITNHITLVAAPTITGYDFDISQPIVAESGNVGRRSVYVTSATRIASIDISSTLLRNVAVLDGEDCDLLHLSASGESALAGYGINFSQKYDESTDQHLVQINLEPELTNALANGEYSFVITATNASGNGGSGLSSSATVLINVSDAPVINLPVKDEEVGTRSAVLRGTVAKDTDEDRLGFNYRTAGSGQWTFVAGTPVGRSFAAGTEFTATVGGLQPNTRYEYAVVCGSFVSPTTQVFATAAEPQLPNAGFETWNTSGKVYLIAADDASMFWDSGNHGSAATGANITTPESTIKHSGNYSAKLETSQLFGVIAAGNIFTGHFLGTENVTKGILGWGRPFTGHPKAMKLWVKYTPAAISKTGDYKGSDISVGSPDKGIVYVALLDDTKASYQSYSWPVIVRTADLAGYSFKKDAANVVAYGEHIFAEATPGSDMIEVTIPIDDKRPGAKVSNILVVASASIYGDYYCGGKGSTMYIDDVELIY